MQRDSIVICVDVFSYHTSVISTGVQAWGSEGHGAEQSAHEGQVTKIGKL
jgi:hypothetical protein